MTKYILYFDIDIACILLLSINQSMLSTFIQISDSNLSLKYRDKDQEELYCLHGRQLRSRQERVQRQTKSNSTQTGLSLTGCLTSFRITTTINFLPLWIQTLQTEKH